MTNSINKIKSLLDIVKRPKEAKRKPSNFALYWAWAFYNLVALLFDVIAAGTVYDLMGKLTYAILTFAAGFLPLLMHEFLFTRAYASGWQKMLAVIGAGLSVVTIMGVGVLAGIVNITGISASSLTLEIVLIVTLVLVAGGHGMIAAVYFYIDEGIKSNQVRAESVAYHERMMDDIKRAKEILALAEVNLNEQEALASQHGGEVLNEVLSQLRGESLAASDAPAPIPPAQGVSNAANVPAPVTGKSIEETEVAELQPVPLHIPFSGNGQK
ncbi:MAG: hypothetical protein IT315_06805 [Anaerolineales bacterium]|nr:hypothetical protein [Anaerolineales bacterium]